MKKLLDATILSQHNQLTLVDSISLTVKSTIPKFTLNMNETIDAKDYAIKMISNSCYKKSVKFQCFSLDILSKRVSWRYF